MFDTSRALQNVLVVAAASTCLFASLSCDSGDGGDDEATACFDMLDNDGDGLTDFPQDPGCDSEEDDDESNPPLPACSDRIDNDGDGRVDYPVDPGCFDPFANDESDGCPSDVLCPQCANLIDDDGDGLLDYPNDPDCEAAVDDDEFESFRSCDSALGVADVTPPATLMGMAMSGQSNLESSPTCGGGGKESVYRMVFTEPRLVVATTDFPETTLDTVLYMRSSCSDPSSELICSNDIADPGGSPASRIEVNLEPGAYYLFADAREFTSAGEYRLQIDTYVAQGEVCDPEVPGQCAPGYECNPRMSDPPDGPTTYTCEAPACRDGMDNDDDGAVDYPEEPGCTDLEDNDETDDCPAGPNCPACANEVDDDGDGATDYPADSGCTHAGHGSEVDCPSELDPFAILTAGTTLGTTSGASDDWTPSCNSSTAGDLAFVLPVSAPLTSLTIDTNGSSYDTILTVKRGGCEQPELECDDDDGDSTQSLIALSTVDPDSYVITVDGYMANTGTFQLNVHGVIANGEACDPDQIASGLFACSADHSCVDHICTPAACSNMEDDDSDGRIDYLEDPGCMTPDDDDELDDCPSGSMCPVCSNGADDDGDGDIDYPADLGCTSAIDDNEENCLDSDPLVVVDMPVITGDTSTGTDDFTPSCNTSNAPDIAHVMNIPGALATLHVDTLGSSFDTILYVRLGECSTTDFACDDDTILNTQSELDLVDVPAGPAFLLVDGYSSNAGSYVLNVSGEIRAGESCDSPLVAQGVLTCEAGYTCNGMICAL